MELEPKPDNRSEWHDRSQPPVSFSAPVSHFAFASGSSALLPQRRRSSAAHVRPAGPPPNLPIPSVPASSQTAMHHQGSTSHQPDDLLAASSYSNERVSLPASLPRPGGFSVLTTIASPPNPPVQTQGLPSLPITEDLTDPPPESILRPSSSRPAERREAPSERLLSPPEARSEYRPSSRRALTRALELAREAVQLDGTNDNPEAAVNAYAQSVALLSEVMDRVRRGEDSTEPRRGRRPRSAAAQEQEIRRLQSIHDTYADRMNILSIIYSIPAVPYSTSSMYSSMTLSTDSTRSPSPTNSTSPDESPKLSQFAYHSNLAQDEPPAQFDEHLDSAQHEYRISSAPTVVLDDAASTGIILASSSSQQHPYAAQPDPPLPLPGSRASMLIRRRALTNLPPAPPPPMNSLPPAPMTAGFEPPIDHSLPLPPQGRHDLLTHQPSHMRSSSLEVLEEENDGLVGQRSSRDDFFRNKAIVPDTPRTSKPESPPLPPLPTSSNPLLESPGTPRTTSTGLKAPLSPKLPITLPLRPRGTSQPQLTTRTELATQRIISLTTDEGTISKRRAGKPPILPASRPVSPADSTASTGSIPTQSKPTTPSNANGRRSRSSSQPGRQPSIIGGRISPSDQRPPLPGTNGTTMRKSSFPSKFYPNAPLTLQTESLSPYGPNQPIGQQAAFSSMLPTTPVSPLPPAPPTDPILKPYHMMSLLQSTMVSSTGGYVTRRLHVPCEVWSQGGAKLSNLVEKVRVVGILCSALDDLSLSSSESFGAGNVCSGLALGIGSIGRKEADQWLAKLEEFSNVCDGVVANFGKKLGVGEGFVLKKTTWGDKITRRFDKFTNGKNLDSPAAYVQGLKKLFQYAQLLDEHTRAVSSHPMAPSYAAFPPDCRQSAEQKLKRSSEFFASVVLTFVIRDLSQLLDKYAKKCEKWLAE